MASKLKWYKYDLSINGIRSGGLIRARTERSAMNIVLQRVGRYVRGRSLPYGRINVSIELENMLD